MERGSSDGTSGAVGYGFMVKESAMRLGISGLEDQSRELCPSKVYVVACDNISEAVNLALCTLAANDSEVAFEKLFLYGLKATELKRMCVNPDQISKSRARILRSYDKSLLPANFCSELLRDGADPNKTLAVCIASDARTFFTLDDKKRSDLYIKRLISGIKVLRAATLLIVRAERDDRQALLNTLPDPAGLAFLGREDDKLTLDIEFWEAHESRTNGVKAALELTNRGFVTSKPAENSANGRPDAQTFYISGNSFTPDKTYFTRILRFNTEREVYNAALAQATAATVILQLRERKDYAELSRMIYDLRVRRGGALVIVVWERVRGIRGDTEKLFASCGGSFVFEAQAANTYVSAMLSSLRSQNFKIPSESYESLLSRFSLADSVQPGVKDPMTFVKEASFLLTNLDNTHIESSFVTLMVKRGMSASLCARNFASRRGGDICSFSGDRLWVFLPSCKTSEVEVALKHVFRAPLDSMFSDISVSSDVVRSSEYLKELSEYELARPGSHDADLVIKLSEKKNSKASATLKDLSPLTLMPGGQSLLSDLAKSGRIQK